jgi:multidrug efflux system outer membrane protein
VEVARADFLPDVSLSALLGVSSQDVGKLFEIGSRVPQIKAALHLPLFSSGSLHATYARNQASLAQDAATYRATLYTAARQVNTELAARQRSIAQAQVRREQLLAAQALRASAALRNAQGVEDARGELAATQRWLNLGEAQLQTHTSALDAELGLIRALGGGYRTETRP